VIGCYGTVLPRRSSTQRSLYSPAKDIIHQLFQNCSSRSATAPRRVSRDTRGQLLGCIILILHMPEYVKPCQVKQKSDRSNMSHWLCGQSLFTTPFCRIIFQRTCPPPPFYSQPFGFGNKYDPRPLEHTLPCTKWPSHSKLQILDVTTGEPNNSQLHWELI
jgi:hypothetical protein